METELDGIVGYVVCDHDPLSFSSGRKVVVSAHHLVSPLLQAGPTCGLVSITMAGCLLQGQQGAIYSEDPEYNLNPEVLLGYAKQKGLSRQGEMFSVYFMSNIVTNHLSWKAKILDMESDEFSLEEVIIQMLQGQSAALVPYDAGPNHSPCLAGGHKAHWCVLVGVCLVLDHHTGTLGTATSEILKHCQLRHSRSSHFTIKPDTLACHLRTLFSQHSVRTLLESNCVYVFARQGKSKHLGLWSLKDLLQSNGNLKEIDPKRSDSVDYVIPEGGIIEGLRNKILLIEK